MKRCNYAVKYCTKNNEHDFGIIKYFIKINDKILVSINKLEIVGNLINHIKKRTSTALIGLKRSGLFNRFFSDVVEIDNMFFIESYQLVSQCIIARTEESNKYFISEYTINNEHE